MIVTTTTTITVIKDNDNNDGDIKSENGINTGNMIMI